LGCEWNSIIYYLFILFFSKNINQSYVLLISAQEGLIWVSSRGENRMDIDDLKDKIVEVLVKGPTELPESYLWQYVQKMIDEEIDFTFLKEAVKELIDDGTLEIKGTTPTKKSQMIIGLTTRAEESIWEDDGLRGVKL